MNGHTIDLLKPFCSIDPHRPELRVPLTARGYTFASDAHIAVWASGEYTDSKAPEKYAGIFDNWRIRHAFALEWLAWPRIITGEWLNPIPTPSGILNDHYVRLVARMLPSPQLGFVITDGTALVPFRFDGGNGIIMPLNPTSTAVDDGAFNAFSRLQKERAGRHGGGKDNGMNNDIARTVHRQRIHLRWTHKGVHCVARQKTRKNAIGCLGWEMEAYVNVRVPGVVYPVKVRVADRGWEPEWTEDRAIQHTEQMAEALLRCAKETTA